MKIVLEYTTLTVTIDDKEESQVDGLLIASAVLMQCQKMDWGKPVIKIDEGSKEN